MYVYHYKEYIVCTFAWDGEVCAIGGRDAKVIYKFWSKN